MQSAFEAVGRDEPIANYDRRMGEFDLQYQIGLGVHDVVAGGGARLDHEAFSPVSIYSLTPAVSTQTLVDVFAQDAIRLSRQVTITLGARVERDNLAGWNLQPTASAMWTPTVGQRLWVSTSRAVRTPSLQERGIRAELPADTTAGPLPVHVTLSGNPALKSEHIFDAEAGYRLELRKELAVSLNLFRARYAHLRSSEPGTPTVAADDGGVYLAVPTQFQNLAAARTAGVEVDAQWMPAPWWRVDGSFSGFRLTPAVAASSADPEAAAYDGSAPAHQWQLHSAWTTASVMIDTRVFRVGRLRVLDIDAYTRADARVEVPLSRRLTVSFAGQNLLSPAHAEFSSHELVTATRVPRSARAQIVWRY